MNNLNIKKEDNTFPKGYPESLKPCSYSISGHVGILKSWNKNCKCKSTYPYFIFNALCLLFFKTIRMRREITPKYLSLFDYFCKHIGVKFNPTGKDFFEVYQKTVKDKNDKIENFDLNHFRDLLIDVNVLNPNSNDNEKSILKNIAKSLNDSYNRID